MLFNKKTKIAFVLPTRCGSTSVKEFLEGVGFCQLRHPALPTHHHIKYSEAVELYPELAGYKKYGIYRDPVERFTSTVNYLMCGKDVSPDEFLDFFDKRPDSHLDIFKEPQTEWLGFGDVEVIKFENLATDVPAAAGCDTNATNFPHLNCSSQGKNFSDQYLKIMGIDTKKRNKEIKDFVEQYYLADYEFLNSRATELVVE